jgi:hypothetical protein
MNTKLVCLAVAVTAPVVCLYSSWVCADEPNATRTVVVTRAAPENETAEPAVVQVEVNLSAEGESAAPRAVVVTRGAGSAGAPTTPADPNRGWLGVQLVDVPAAVVAQMPAGAGGEMVLNVAKGSPAEKAGLLQHDIVTAVNGASLSKGGDGVAKAIGGLAPGSEVVLKILRGGKEITVNVTLSSRPAGDAIDWVHELSPEAITREITKLRGKILGKDENGNWRLEDLGDLPEFESLPEEIRKALPSPGEFITKIIVGDDQHKSFDCDVTRDGETIAIRQENGGDIVVKRTDRDGKETEATYANAEALKVGDPAAYEIYQQASEGALVEINVRPGDKDVRRWRGRGPGPGAWFSGNREEWRQQMESAMKEARQAYEEAMKHLDEAGAQQEGQVRRAYEEAMKNMQEARKHLRFRFGGQPEHRFFRWNDDEPAPPAPGEPARSFRVNPDGGIEVTIRKADTEVTKVFRDQADLQQRDPALYEEYTKATSSE